MRAAQTVARDCPAHGELQLEALEAQSRVHRRGQQKDQQPQARPSSVGPSGSLKRSNAFIDEDSEDTLAQLQQLASSAWPSGSSHCAVVSSPACVIDITDHESPQGTQETHIDTEDDNTQDSQGEPQPEQPQQPKPSRAAACDTNEISRACLGVKRTRAFVQPSCLATQAPMEQSGSQVKRSYDGEQSGTPYRGEVAIPVTPDAVQWSAEEWGDAQWAAQWNASGQEWTEQEKFNWRNRYGAYEDEQPVPTVPPMSPADEETVPTVPPMSPTGTDKR
jgi:hypothetical protein